MLYLYNVLVHEYMCMKVIPVLSLYNDDGLLGISYLAIDCIRLYSSVLTNGLFFSLKIICFPSSY